MKEFVSQPPSIKSKPLGKFFQGGLMPAAPQNIAALLVFDIRSLKLRKAEGKKLEAAVREFVFSYLEKTRDFKDRSAVDLSGSVFGIAID